MESATFRKQHCQVDVFLCSQLIGVVLPSVEDEDERQAYRMRPSSYHSSFFHLFESCVSVCPWERESKWRKGNQNNWFVARRLFARIFHVRLFSSNQRNTHNFTTDCNVTSFTTDGCECLEKRFSSWVAKFGEYHRVNTKSCLKLSWSSLIVVTVFVLLFGLLCKWWLLFWRHFVNTVFICELFQLKSSWLDSFDC